MRTLQMGDVMGWDEGREGTFLYTRAHDPSDKTGTSLVEDRAQCHSLVSSED